MKIIGRIILHLVGYLLMALGIALMVRSNQGVYPYDVINYYLSVLINKPFIDLGMASIITGTALSIINFILLRKKEVFYSFLMLLVFGYFISFWLMIIKENYIPSTLVVGITVAFLGVIVFSIGVSLIIFNKDFPITPPELTLMYLNEKLHKTWLAKLITEIAFLATGLILATVYGSYHQVGWFTIISVPLTSIFIDLFHKLFSKIIKNKE